jgi:hypothetical protein
MTRTIRPTLDTVDHPMARSEARRLLQGIGGSGLVCLDFTGLTMIGQAFADEVFRVFVNAHPNIKLYAVSANPSVTNMIRHVAGDRADAILDTDEAC